MWAANGSDGPTRSCQGGTMTTGLLPENRSEERLRPGRGALAVLATAQLVLALDYSIVNIALPSIGGSLGFSRDAVEWVVSAYTLLFGGFLLFGGRSSDLLGRRRIFIASGVLFGVASMVGGLSTTPAMLLVGRALQGLAAGFLFPATLSLVTTTFPERPSRNRAISVWGAAGAGGRAPRALPAGGPPPARPRGLGGFRAVPPLPLLTL